MVSCRSISRTSTSDQLTELDKERMAAADAAIVTGNSDLSVADLLRQIAARLNEKPTAVGLDDLLDSKAAGAWLGLSERELLSKSKGHNPKILAYWLNQRLVRWHPRAVLTKMASEAGLSPQLIAAMFAAPLLSDEVVRGVKQRWTGNEY